MSGPRDEKKSLFQKESFLNNNSNNDNTIAIQDDEKEEEQRTELKEFQICRLSSSHEEYKK